ncbi:GH1 family beta-glucosidase [Allorhizobium sp. BGMRC 0089]|uniref:GH1 family beta-glucosidase n=1 Tax=Allorhizobium sonneratiae TaxID=2934936 RepID=UPI0020341D14|nr:GH1 family beta-glucosidase [Allorhizobium sonneratiae]MCM2293166.1 GH1 family beta-glucosidase [Allorhizobium sonneratiae]
MMRAFPKNFLWGVAASAYQTEGAVEKDGRGQSVWDVYAHTPGRTTNGDTADIACDHYHRYPEDIALMSGLGVKAYRLSTAWPRIYPHGKGQVNRRGLDFYDRVIDLLLHEGIEPWICLHHWDMPVAIEEKGGWRNRDTARIFADYAATVIAHFSDRVKRFAPINEPNVIPWVAYNVGRHAPGQQDYAACLAAIHTLNLAHGHTVKAVRAEAPKAEVGNIVSLGPVRPHYQDAAHEQAVVLGDCLWRRVTVDPLWLGIYPEPIASEIEPLIQGDDMDVISQKMDFFGLNHYNPVFVGPNPTTSFGISETPPPIGMGPLTDVNWVVDPDAFLEQIRDTSARYNKPVIYITENGASFADALTPDRKVIDPDRIAYFNAYLGRLLDAIEEGHDIRGYFAWSLMDNFEWGRGFSKRFGLVYVDYPTLQRIPKASYHWLSGVIGQNGL